MSDNCDLTPFGLPLKRWFYWFKCHGCGAEYAMSEGVRGSGGCSNPECYRPDIHIHSDKDGERPATEFVRAMSSRVIRRGGPTNEHPA